jgi:hypothetical protein
MNATKGVAMSFISPRAVTVATLLLVFAVASEAQMPGGGQRRPRSDQQPPSERRDEGPPRAAPASDPVLALERELPSLRTDLGLAVEQRVLWAPFERSVRDAAELTRQNARKRMAPRPVDAPAPNAMAVIASLADDDRMRSDAMADAAARMKSLYEALTSAQQSMLDRRLLLSQSEPLGPSR